MSDPHDPDVGSFLLLLAARRSPRTVDAYRRDLASFAATIDHPVGAATTEEIEAWLATMRAHGAASLLVDLAALEAEAAGTLLSPAAGGPPRRPAGAPVG